MAAWQREWLEPYEVKDFAPFSDLTLMLDTGVWVYAKAQREHPLPRSAAQIRMRERIAARRTA